METQKPLQVYLPSAIASHMQGAMDSMHQVFGGRRSLNVQINPMRHGDEVPIRKGMKVKAVRTYHGVPSCGWVVEQTTSKLKPEYRGVEGRKIAELRKSGAQVTREVVSTMLAIPGDTRIDFMLREEQARKAKVLVHEVTYWDNTLSSVEGCRKYGHVHADEMIEHCDKFEGEALVLVHRSMKYSRSQVEKIVNERFPAAMRSKIHVFDGGDRGTHLA